MKQIELKRKCLPLGEAGSSKLRSENFMRFLVGKVTLLGIVSIVGAEVPHILFTLFWEGLLGLRQIKGAKGNRKNEKGKDTNKEQNRR